MKTSNSREPSLAPHSLSLTGLGIPTTGLVLCELVPNPVSLPQPDSTLSLGTMADPPLVPLCTDPGLSTQWPPSH